MDWDSIQKEMENELKSIYKTTKKLNKDPDRQLYDRLQSIVDDYSFVTQVQNDHPSEWPTFANLRCGLWYAPNFDYTCYFKSTDGHVGKWAFSISRLNINVAEAASKYGGVLIIDSTRKGKRYPDSFSRTIPIWTCIINRAVSILRSNPPEWDTSLHMPPWVPKSEQSQVEKRLDGFVQTLLSSGADLSLIVSQLKKPLQCMWVSPSEISVLDEEKPNFEEFVFTPIVCVSVSKAVTEEKRLNTSAGAASFYIQGAGDDEESWAKNLTPALFWANMRFIMGSGPAGIVSRIKSIKNRNVVEEAEDDFVTEEELISKYPIKIVDIGDTKLAIGCYLEGLNMSIFEKYNAVINTSPSDYSFLTSKENYIHLPVLDGKSDKNKLAKIFPEALDFISKQLKQGHSVLIHSYKDLNAPVCVCVAALVNFFSFEGELLQTPRADVAKTTVRNQFVFIEKFCPQSRPPKVMTNEVNRYFMTPANLQSKQLQKYKEDKNKDLKT